MSCSAVLHLHLAQREEIFLQRLVVSVVLVFFHDRNNGGAIHKAREVVDVPVGVVALDPFAQPEEMAYAEVVAQVLLDRGDGRESGLRFGLSRQERVVSRVPAPFTSMEPPSSTMPGE